MRALVSLLFALLLSAAAPLAAQEDTGVGDSRAALETLLEVLRDDAARQALIGELERNLAAQPDVLPETEAEPEPEPAPVPLVPSEELRSLGGRIADATREAVEDAAASVSQLWRQLSYAPNMFRALGPEHMRTFGAILADLALLIAITYGGFLLLRALSKSVRGRLATVFGEGGWVAKPVAVALELALDLLVVVIPWALGYAIAVGLLGMPGEISFPHSLYLNAFLMVEAAMAVVRTVVSPAEAQQRLIALTSRQARFVMLWSRLFVGLFVFGQMLVLPLFNRTISYAAGRAISVLLMLALLALAALAVVLARKAVARMLLRVFTRAGARKSLRGLFSYWYAPALLYLGGLAVAALTRSTNAFQAILWANGQIALAIIAGVIVSGLLTRMIGRGVHLPGHVNQRVPLLERQLNAFVPFTLSLLRILVLLAVVLFCLHMLGLFDVIAFLESQIGARMTGAALTVAAILLGAFVFWVLLNSWVDYRVNPDFSKRVTARERTLLMLMRNALTIAIIVITLMVVLSELGINIAPLLASAGVIGLAIGFGAQKLVQDIITGIFIQLEGAIDVGDVVSVAGISGVVERLTIRSVSLRDSEGSYHVIPFSTVAAVTNFMRGFSYAVVDVTVGYREDGEAVKQAMFTAFERLKKESSNGRFVVGDLDWNGVNSLSLTDIVLRAKLKTAPGKQWGVKRSYNALVRQEFLARGIGLPEDQKPKPAELAKLQPDPEPEEKPRKRKGKEDVDLPDLDAGPDSSRD